MFGIPTGVLTGSQEYRDNLRAQPAGPTAQRDVILAVVFGLYLPVVAGVAWAWLHDYSPIEYWLSAAVAQAAGLSIVCGVVLTQSIVRVWRHRR